MQTGAADEAKQCAICFEAIDAGIDLPCRCQADYCAKCWDRALAKSFNSCAKARCPTCRAPVRVDYDAASDCLVFSAELVDEHADETRQRLAQQLRPVQVQILKDFGTAHPVDPQELRSAAQEVREVTGDAAAPTLAPSVAGVSVAPGSPPAPPEATVTAPGSAPAPPEATVPADMFPEVARLAAEAAQALEGGPAPQPPAEAAAPTADEVAAADAMTVAALRHAAHLAGRGLSPRCVCGSLLELISMQERHRRFVQQAESWRYSQQLASLLASGAMRIVCDLCNRPLIFDHINRECVWACQTGDTTIKHATSNDICARCFVLHAWGIDEVEALE